MLFIKGMENAFHFERPKSFISIEFLETEIKYYRNYWYAWIKSWYVIIYFLELKIYLLTFTNFYRDKDTETCSTTRDSKTITFGFHFMYCII